MTAAFAPVALLHRSRQNGDPFAPPADLEDVDAVLLKRADDLLFLCAQDAGEDQPLRVSKFWPQFDQQFAKEVRDQNVDPARRLPGMSVTKQELHSTQFVRARIASRGGDCHGVDID